MKTEAYYLKKLFYERLNKTPCKLCPKCDEPIKDNYQYLVGTKKFYCGKCSYQISPLAGTVFSKSHVPITKWLDVTIRVHEAERIKREIMAKEIAIDFNQSPRTSYRMLKTINGWNRSFQDRTSLEGLFALIAQTSPPLFQYPINKSIIQ